MTKRSNLADHVSTKATPQSEPIPGKQMAKNNAGGYVFRTDCWTRLERFLVLGSEGGTYYVDERRLTKENAACVHECADVDFPKTLRTVVEVSCDGRAPKNDYCLLALALLASRKHKPLESSRALAELNRVARTGTHLFQFLEYSKRLRGRGRAMKRAMQDWYMSKPPRALAVQVTKYAQRGGMSHRDVLRLAKPPGVESKRRNNAVVTQDDLEREGVLRYVTRKDWNGMPSCDAKEYLEAVCRAKTATIKEIKRLITLYSLPWEVLPSAALNSPDVWDAMLPSMGATAMLRNLGKMASVGLLTPMSRATRLVGAKFCDPDWLRRGRLHPFAILLGSRVYASGHGVKGSLQWQPDSHVLQSLGQAFHLAFQAVTPTGKNHLLGLDVSGSMGVSLLGSSVSCREAAAAMALVTARVEPIVHSMAFSDSFQPFPILPHDSLETVARRMSGLNFGRTDCALPMLYAAHNKIEVDTFVVYTDNETWYGHVHPVQALEDYRQKMSRPAKLAVVAFSATDFSIADPTDAGMMDFVGFDAAAPRVLADFSRGEPEPGEVE